MPVPLPTDEEVLHQPPDVDEVRVIVGGVAGAIAPEGGLTELQRLLVEAISEEMTGFVAPAGHVPRLSPQEFAVAMALPRCVVPIVHGPVHDAGRARSRAAARTGCVARRGVRDRARRRLRHVARRVALPPWAASGLR